MRPRGSKLCLPPRAVVSHRDLLPGQQLVCLRTYLKRPGIVQYLHPRSDFSRELHRQEVALSQLKPLLQQTLSRLLDTLLTLAAHQIVMLRGLAKHLLHVFGQQIPGLY